MLGIASVVLASLATLAVTGAVLAVRADPARRQTGKLVAAIGFGLLATGAGLGLLGAWRGDLLAAESALWCAAFLGLVVAAVFVDVAVFRALAWRKMMAEPTEVPMDLPVSDGPTRGGGDEHCRPSKKAEGGGAVPVERRNLKLFWRDSLWGDYSYVLYLNVLANDSAILAIALSEARQRNFWTTTVTNHSALARATGQITCDEVGDDCIPDCTGGENPSDDGPCSAAVLIKGTVAGKNLNVEVTCAASYTAHVTIKKVTVGATGAVGGTGGSVSVDIDLPPGDAPKEKVVRTLKYVCRPLEAPPL